MVLQAGTLHRYGLQTHILLHAPCVNRSTKRQQLPPLLQLLQPYATGLGLQCHSPSVQNYETPRVQVRPLL